MTDQLADALGVPPPPAVAGLPDEVRDRLAAQVRAAQRRELRSAQAALETALKGVPLPVRGLVRKALT
jgi:hypothetical protein